MNSSLAITAIAVVCLVTLTIGAFGFRFSRTTSDFYVASRMVTPTRNASAIGGEYISAASFLGVAGLVYSLGADMLWLPVGYTVGYLVLLLLVAAPLRRSGAYTLPDFAEARLESVSIRRLSSVLDIRARSWSKMRRDPSDGRSSPAIRFRRVDLPDPEVPSRPTNSPSSTFKDTPSRARTVAAPIW